MAEALRDEEADLAPSRAGERRPEPFGRPGSPRLPGSPGSSGHPGRHESFQHHGSSGPPGSSSLFGFGIPSPPGGHGPPRDHDPRRRRRQVAAVALLGTFLLLNASASAPTRPGTLNRITTIAYAIEAGQHQPGWWGGEIPYSWGGGHGEDPGPSFGICEGYRGSIKPCPATKTLGLDCSGLARWVYHLAYGRDVLGPGNTDDHVKRLRRVPAAAAEPGDLVFYGKVGKRKVSTHHVGVYVGRGKMINALRTGTEVRIDRVTALDDLAGYFRYTGPR